MIDVFSPDFVARARVEDAARDRLLTEVREVALRFFQQRMKDPVEAEDLAQNTVIRVLHGLPALRDNRACKSFVLKAALYELQDHYRGRYALREQLMETLLPGSEGVAESGLPPFDTLRALSNLTPSAQKVLELKAWGYRYEEIAEITGTTEAAIKMQVKRALEKLRTLLSLLLALSLAHG